MNSAPTFILGDGKVTTDFGPGLETGHGVAIQSDGKILVAGESNGNFALVRYNADGTLDPDFDGDGRLTTPIGAGNDFGYSLALQADGRILVAGESHNGSNYDFALVRYNPDGSPDTTFDLDGIVTTPIGSSDDAGASVAVQSDGKIVVSGSTLAPSGHFLLALTRYNSDGSLDSAFGAGGVLATDIDLSGEVVIDPAGRLVVAGSFWSSGAGDFGLVRFNGDGTLDATFGSGGTVTTSFGTTDDVGRGIALQPDGKIVVAGTRSSPAISDFAVARYNHDGTLDTSFDFDGRVTTDLAFRDDARDVFIQDDGKIVVVGGNAITGFAVARYNANGSLDTSFDLDGKLTTDFGVDNDVAYAAVLQADGKIVVAGTASTLDAPGTSLAVARYNPDGSLDATFDSTRTDTLGGAAAYTGDSGAVVLDSSVRINDPDLVATGNYAGATITLARHGGANSQDVFSASGDLGAFIHGGDLTLSGVTIGRVVGNSAGMLTLRFNENALQNRIDEALSAIAYANIGNGPPSEVQIDWTFSDGNSGAQGGGGPLTAAGATTVSVTHNHAPTVAHPPADQRAVEGSAFSFIVPPDAFADVDAGDPLSYTAAMANGAALPDWLGFNGASRSFSGTPPAGAVGALSIRITATDSGDVAVSDFFRLTVQHPTTGTAGNDTLIGTAVPDAIDGLAGNDTLTGGEGSDMLNGGSGNDVLVGETSATNLTLSGFGSGGITVIDGETIKDVLNGGAGNDLLDGGIGDDTMAGGAGNDTYIVSSGLDVLVEATGGGTDTVKTYITYALPDHVENLTLLGSVHTSATGNTLGNVLTGSNGRNGLFGGAGNDTLDGGNDNDKLNGGSGADNLQGGEGDDVFLLDSTADFAAGEVIDGGAGSNELRYIGTAATTLTLTANVTNVGRILISDEDGDRSGTAAINVDGSAAGNGMDFKGNAGNNVFTGTGQNDFMSGGFGNDTLTGGAGDDVLNGNAGDDVFLIAAGAHHGVDEYVDGAGGVIDGGGFNVIRFTSTTANDTLTLSSHVTNIAEIEISNAAGANSGTKALNVNASALTGGLAITGNAGANHLTGTGGADVLTGGGGADTQTGGSGDDTFRYLAKSDSTLAGTDTITDFGGGDTLDFTGMGGVTLRAAPYAYQTSVANTVALIKSDGGISGAKVFFSDGASGYLYVKGAGTGVDFDGTLIRLTGHTEMLSNAQITSVVPLSGNPLVDGLVSGNAWHFPEARTLTWSVSIEGEAPGGLTQEALINRLTPIFAAWSQVVDIQFQEVAADSGAATSPADIAIRFTHDDALTGGGAGLVIGPSLAEGDALLLSLGLGRQQYANPEGDIFLDSDAAIFTGAELQLGGQGYAYMLHEIGYALGLKRPDEHGPNGRPTFGELGIAWQDTAAYTVMSLAEDGGASPLGNAFSPMMLDIAAIQRMYGAPVAPPGPMLITLVHDGFINTIWHPGGHNTYDASGLTGDGNLIDLHAGSFVVNGDGSILTAAALDTPIADALGSAYADTILGTDTPNVLDGGAGDDWIEGRAGNDTLQGGSGADRLAGGAGDDTYYVQDAGDAVVEFSNEGTDTVFSYGNWTLAPETENLTLVEANGAEDPYAKDDPPAPASSGGPIVTGVIGTQHPSPPEGFDATGNAFDNVVRGNRGSDRLDGLDGNDRLHGGKGYDTLNGGEGNDRLDGGPGVDTLIGGDGDDTYIVGDAGALFNLSLEGEQGNPVLDGTSRDWDLSNYIPGVVLADRSGDGLVDTISIQNGGFLTFDPRLVFSTWRTGQNLTPGTYAGAMLDGLETTDHASFSVGGPFAISMGLLGAAIGSFTIHSAEIDYSGTDGPRLVQFSVSFEQRIPDGDIEFIPEDEPPPPPPPPPPSLFGTLVVDNNVTVESIIEQPGEGTDSVYSSITYALGADVENLRLTGTADIDGTGNAGDNTIAGNAGDNVLDGGDGMDTASYASAAAGVRVKLAVSTAQDTAGAGVDTLTSFENLTGSAFQDTLTGNSEANRLRGGSGNDTLNGGSGTDTLIGGSGNDTYEVNSTLDAVTEAPGKGTDLVQSSAAAYTLPEDVENLTLVGPGNLSGTGNSGKNVLTGNSGRNALNGGSGNDVLSGLAGADVLTGGAGADRFDFNAVSHSGPGNSTRDRISDFKRSESDRIDLSGIDAKAGGDDDAFKFIGTKAFSANASGQLRFDPDKHLLLGSTDADGAAEFSILLTGVSSMTGSNFIL